MDLEANTLTGRSGENLAAEVLRALAAIDDAAMARRPVFPAGAAVATDPAVGHRLGAGTPMIAAYAIYTLGGATIGASTEMSTGTPVRLG